MVLVTYIVSKQYFPNITARLGVIAELAEPKNVIDVLGIKHQCSGSSPLVVQHVNSILT
jgi:hypothetical protein